MKKPLLAEVIKGLPCTSENHLRDGGNMWFGVSRDQAGDCLLSEGFAYEELLLENPVASSATTYPGLVSFIGDTGEFHNLGWSNVQLQANLPRCWEKCAGQSPYQGKRHIRACTSQRLFLLFVSYAKVN